MGFLRVGDLVCLKETPKSSSHEYGDGFFMPTSQIVPVVPRSVCYFVASLTDSDPLELGLAFYPCEVQIDGQAVPFGLPYWMWTGAVRTRDLKTFSKLMHFAAEIGVEAAMSFARMTLIYSRDDAGRVKSLRSGTTSPTTVEGRFFTGDRGFRRTCCKDSFIETFLRSP